MVELLLILLFLGFVYFALSTAYLSWELKSTKDLYLLETKFILDLMDGKYGVWGQKNKGDK